MFWALENSPVMFLFYLKTEGCHLKPAYWMPLCMSPSTCGMWRQVRSKLCSMLQLHQRTLSRQDTLLPRAVLWTDLLECIMVKNWTLRHGNTLFLASCSLSEDLYQWFPTVGHLALLGTCGSVWRQFWLSQLGCSMLLTPKDRGQRCC